MTSELIRNIVTTLIGGLELSLMIRVLLSWIPHSPTHPVVQILYQITDPILRPFQGIVPPTRFGIDFSPIFAFIALGILKQVLLQLL